MMMIWRAFYNRTASYYVLPLWMHVIFNTFVQVAHGARAGAAWKEEEEQEEDDGDDSDDSDDDDDEMMR
jgi:hypothetical protein